MIFAVDFDGCLASGEKWPEVGEPNETFINWLIVARQQGHKVILWTCRVGEALQKAVDMCRENGLEFDAVNDNLPEIIEYYGSNSRKIYADFYFDDKSVVVKYPERTSDE